MQSFTILTDTPGKLATFLESRGILQRNANGSYSGVLPGMEWVELPNPIITDNSDPENPVYDTRHLYLVKFAHESEAADADGPLVDEEGNRIDQYDRTKFGKWVKANSSVVTAPANYTFRNGDPVGNARKINGQNVWLTTDERFGGWA